MEEHFSPETEKKLIDLAAENGRASADELVQQVIDDYFAELFQTRSMLGRRYEELKSGRVSAIPGSEIEAHFRELSAAARSLLAST